MAGFQAATEDILLYSVLPVSAGRFLWMNSGKYAILFAATILAATEPQGHPSNFAGD